MRGGADVGRKQNMASLIGGGFFDKGVLLLLRGLCSRSVWMA